MGFGDFCILLFAKIFTVLSWPSFTLVCPLYASVRAIESNSNSKTQRCLAFWVLFCLTTYLELALGKPYTWVPFWPQAKGLITILLVIPYFGGASYVYKNFIGPYMKNILLFSRKSGFIFLYALEGNGSFNGSEELEKVVVCEEKSETTLLANAKKVQQEWSCAMCLVNMTSPMCLTAHLRGKKHKAKEDELRADEMESKKGDSSPMPKNPNKWSPVTRSIRLCKWKKPKLGWTKLNVDGSINKENAGFGGLLRDHDGTPVCAFVSKSKQGDVFLVELWAIWRGLVLASGLGIKVIWIESDSLSVVKTIKREQPYGPKAGSCLYHIWELLSKFEKYKVSHSWRETNRAADFFSKMVVEGNDVVLWPGDFPESVNKIVKDDAQGKIYHRS